MVRNVSVNVDMCFRLSCELVGWLTILGFPVNLLADWLLPNLKRWESSTPQVVGEGESVSWGVSKTKGEMSEWKITKNIFLRSDLLKLRRKKKHNITEFFLDKTVFYD